MPVKSDEIHLLTIKPEETSLEKNQGKCQTPLINNNIVNSKENDEKILTKPSDDKSKQIIRSSTTQTATQISQSAEDRQRTGRYLAVGVILIMLFIAFYHTLMRHTSVLAGLTAPAVIMLLYILWLLYFAKKKKRQVTIV